MIVAPSLAAAIHRRLLSWFGDNARPLPWRSTRDPYRIWISEVMLQQTQVVTVIPYYQRFLKHFPSLTRLAKAREHDVLVLWEGLGYYRRARDLFRASRILRENDYTTIPDDPDVVRSLPGFGRYTTNAVLSQAYDRRVPILEANSQRVLCRLFGIDRNPKEAAVQKRLWELAEELLPTKSVGDFNQGMMELGALVCTPATPSCHACPLHKHCRAYQENRQHELPVRAKVERTIAVTEVAIMVNKGDRWLVVQRPNHGRWGGLWEFPHEALQQDESAEAVALTLLDRLGLHGVVGDHVGSIRHAVTRFRIRLTALCVRMHGGRLKTAAYRNAAWVRLEDLPGYPLSAPQRRLARLLESARNNAKAQKRKTG